MKKLLSLISLALLVFACSEDKELANNEQTVDLTPAEYISIAFNQTSTDIGEAQAINLVNDFSKGISTRALSASAGRVINKYYINDFYLTRSSSQTENRIPIYVVSLSNKTNSGFSIVSGDARNPCVLMYSEQGNINDTTENKGAKYMLEEAELSLQRRLCEYRYIRDSLRESTIEKIKKQLKVDKVDFEQIKDRIRIIGGTRASGIENPTDGRLWKEVKPLISTKWDQSSPYNDLLEKTKSPDDVNIYYYGGRNAVGCTGTAVSQIVALYQTIHSAYGVYLNWDEIKVTPIITNYYSSESLKKQVANLCKFVAIGIGTKWSDSGEGGANMKNSYNFLNSNGITFDTGDKYRGFDMNAVRIVESLDLGYPVFVTGQAEAGTRSSSSNSGGHCWILDGCQMRTRPAMTRAIVKANDVYVHANFGWGGDEDGYYLVDRNTTNLTFDTSHNGKYNQRLRLFTRVRKK